MYLLPTGGISKFSITGGYLNNIVKKDQEIEFRTVHLMMMTKRLGLLKVVRQMAEYNRLMTSCGSCALLLAHVLLCPALLLTLSFVCVLRRRGQLLLRLPFLPV